MAAFDVEGYRKAAKAAGISNAEIENEIKFQTNPSEKSDPFQKEDGGFKLGSLDQIQERLGNDWWHLPAGLAVLGAAAYGAEKLMGGVGKPEAPQSPRIDPTMSPEPVQPLEPVKPSLPQQTNLTPEDIQARAAQLKAVAPEMPVSTPISAAPIDAPAPKPSSGPGSFATEAVVSEIKDMIQETPAQPVEAAKPPAAAPAPVAPPQELRTGTGKPAFAGQGPEAALNKKGQPKFKSEYADINAVPRGYAFVPGADKIDTLRNTLGQQAYTEAFKNLSFPSTNEMAMQQASEINRMLGRPTRDELIAAGKTPAANTPGITQPTNPPKGSGMGTKATRVGGLGIGALVAIPDLAKANTAAERGMAAANLLEAFLPPGFMMSGAGEGSDRPPRYTPPLSFAAQTEMARQQNKRLRQETEYIRKIGGAVPPPMR